MLEEMQDGYFEVDLAGNHTFVNDAFCRVLGYAREEMLGMNYRVYVAEEDSKTTREVYNHVYRTGVPLIGFVHRVVRKDGAPRLVEFSAFVVRNKAREIIGFRGVGRDITERKRAEQQLLTTSKLASVGELASGVAHELNNPLTGIIGYAQLLTSRGNVPQDVKTDLDRIYHESQRAAKIVQNLLSFARQRKPHKAYLDVNELIQETLELRDYELRTSNIGIYVNLAPGLPWVIADYHQIQQVILNILINAEQALAEGKRRGRITVTTSAVEGYVEISIADNGPGIAREDIGRLFDPFFTTKEVGSGTGLGLSVCHGIVTEHGGKIDVESQKGKGATFTIELPLATSGEAVVEEKEPAAKTSRPQRQRANGRILIVDDEPSINDVLTRALSEHGYVTDSALTAKTALQKIAGNNYELYIIDLKMPRTSGKRLYQIMRQRYPSLAEKVVFITGDTTTPATQNFLASTGKPYLAKPFGSDQVIELVEETIGGRQ
jgi:PAS domain S-box-containing protein